MRRLIGQNRFPSIVDSSGVWDLNELHKGRLMGQWPGLLTPYQGVVMADDPTFFFTFDDEAFPGELIDITENGLHGTHQGLVSEGEQGPFSSERSRSAFYDGGNTIVPANSIFGSGTALNELSFEVWLFPVPEMSSQGNSWIGGVADSWNNPAWNLYLRSGSPGISWQIDGGNFRPSLAPLTSMWHHIVCTYGFSSRTVYLDGVELDTSSANSDTGVASSTEDFDIAGSDKGLNEFLGYISNVAFYRHKLTDNQVLSHFQAAEVL